MDNLSSYFSAKSGYPDSCHRILHFSLPTPFILASLVPICITPSVRARSTYLVRNLPQLRSIHTTTTRSISSISTQNALSNSRAGSVSPTAFRRLDHVSLQRFASSSGLQSATTDPISLASQIRRTLATTMPPITKEQAEGEEYDMFVIGGGSGGLACAVSLHSEWY